MKSVLLLLTTITFLFAETSNAQDTTNAGTEFWVGYGHHQFMETGANSQEMTVYIATGSTAAVVTVSIDSTTWWRTYNIPANTVIDLATTTATSFASGAGAVGPIPKSGSYDARLFSTASPVGSGSTGTFRQKAIHVESNTPVVAYAHIYGSTSSGATLLLPVQAWGGLYTSANSNQSYASNAFSWMYVVAKYDNTVIEVTPTVKTRAQDQTGLQPGATKTITLMRGQIYQILGANLTSDINGNGGTSSSGYELTGTTVKSVVSPTGYTHPIAVFSGSSRTSNTASSCGSGGGDNDIQQHFPRQALGKIYLTAPFSKSPIASASQTSIYKIVVFDPATVVARNGAILSGLIANTYYTFESNTADYITADQPILVAQFMTGGACQSPGVGDPEMVYLSPLSQGVSSARFYRNTREMISVNYLTVITPTLGLPTLTIDGSSVFDTTYIHPNLPGYSVAVKRWAAAQAQSYIEGTLPFTGVTYGLGSVESYGYNIGTKLNAVNARDASQLPPGFTGLLPLKLTSFTATRHDADVQLAWSTVNETHMNRFEVERSLNGATFNSIQTVASQGDGSFVYSATDEEALNLPAANDAIYYRLKMIDNDGKYSCSAVEIIKMSRGPGFTVRSTPNPFQDRVQLHLSTEKQGILHIRLIDINGKALQVKSQHVASGNQVIVVETPANVPAGVYMLEVSLNGKTERIRLVK